MLKGTRDGILKKVQPISIHGQPSWDVYFTDVDDPDGQVSVARIGPEAVIGTNLEPGDRIRAQASMNDPTAQARGYVPDTPSVLFSMPLINAHQSGTLSFDAPTEPGEYPFVCSFPGHWITMRGVLKVE